MNEPNSTPPPSPVDDFIDKVKDIDYEKHLKTVQSALITAGAWIQVTARYTVRGFFAVKPHLASGLRNTASWLDSLKQENATAPPPATPDIADP